MSDSAEPARRSAAAGRANLLADCTRCFGLCCVALPFTASADFAIDKDAGRPCPNLRADFACGIHGTLRQQGFSGCTVYDCFGAGQQVAQVTFAGRDWRQAPSTAEQMFAVFPVMRQLHELMWYLTEALTLPRAEPVYPDLTNSLAVTEDLTKREPAELLELDIAAYRQQVGVLLQWTSELVRAGVRRKRTNHAGADLMGARLRGANLRGASLRGTYLIGADLRDADLRLADFLGADLRAADLRGADLGDSIFLTQFQLNAAKGDDRTTLPTALTRPSHWSA
jgi:uncharacterized protein YjbI with pentapeptide repeats